MERSESIVGSVVDGRYRVAGRIGAGGMGVVYRAVQQPMEREVALKLLDADRGLGSEGETRFLREARLLSRVRHPAVVTVHDCGRTAAGTLWLAMELVTGQPLKELLATETRLPLARALTLGMQLADALDAVHAAGVVHRDVKPSNVMVLPGDRVKLLDFGVARSADGGDTTVTRDDVLCGTPAYMAPEVIRGADAEPRSDLFALGLVLHEMLAGAHPFAAPTTEAQMARILADAPARLEDVPPPLANLIAQLLAKDPNARPRRAALVKERLAAIAGVPTSSARTHRVRLAAPRWLAAGPLATARARVAAAALGLVAVAAVAVGVAAVARPREERFSGPYVSSDAQPCTSGTTTWIVRDGHISGSAVASDGSRFEVIGTMRSDGSAFGAFAMGESTFGSFTGRREGDRVRGTSRDNKYGCVGRFELSRAR